MGDAIPPANKSVQVDIGAVKRKLLRNHHCVVHAVRILSLKVGLASSSATHLVQ